MKFDCMVSRRAALSALPLLAVPPPRAAFAADGLATAYFTAGDPRFLQPAFNDIKYLGITGVTCGAIDDSPVVKVEYNADKLSYKRVLGAFWRGIDPTEQQAWQSGPSIVWAGNKEERRLAEGSKTRLEQSGLFQKRPGIKVGFPIVTQVRDLPAGAQFVANDELTDWYTREAKAYEKQGKQRKQWFEDVYKPITVTACEKQEDQGTVCGFVYFPCTDENGCRGVTQGKWVD